MSGGRDGWRPMLALAAVLAAVVFAWPLALGHPLFDPDEGLHAAIAQEMVERGDWLVPRLLDEPFLDKPAFFTWLQAASLAAFGPHEAAVRLPGLLCGLLGMAATGLVAGRMLGRPTGLVAAAFYATLIVPTALAQAAVCDAALVPLVALAILLFWEADRAATRRAAALLTAGAGMLLGLGCLTKGLAAVALVGAAYGSYLLVTRRLNLAACGRGLAALAVAGVVAAPWYVAVELSHPGYLHYYFVDRHVLGYATASQAHGGQPWWYYLPILLAGGLPWIGYLPVTVHDAWLRRKGTAGPPAEQEAELDCGDRAGATALLWCWLVGCTLFLTLARSKLITYVWPVFPPVAILAAVAWVRLVEGRLAEPARRHLARSFCFSTVFGPVVLPAALLVAQHEFSLRFSPAVWLVTGVVALVSWAPLAFWMAGRFRATIAAATLNVSLHFAVIMAAVLPTVAAATSARDLAAHFNRRGRLPAELLIAEDRVGSVVFYLDRDLRAELHDGRLRRVELDEWPALRPGAVLAVASRWQRLAERRLDLDGRPYRTAGRYRLYDASAIRPRTASSGTCQRSIQLVAQPRARQTRATAIPKAAPTSTSLR